MTRTLPLGGLSISDEFFARLEQEEATLRFARFEHRDAVEVGQSMLALAGERGQSIAGSVWLGEQIVFRFALPGTSADSDHWLDRKAATVRRYDASSFLVASRFAGYGRVPDAALGVDSIRYAFAGGGVPIRVGATQIGVVAATGVNDWVEHDLVVEVLRARLASPAA